MRLFHRANIVLILLAVVSCSSSGPDAAPTTREEVLAGYASAGLADEVADCVVGLGERELGLDDLVPGGATDDLTRALVDEVIASCVEAAAILAAEPIEPEVLAFDAGPFTLGDDERLDFLWDGCEAGDGRACDRLWLEAPIGSDYENFGVTCGNRLDLLDCASELVLEPLTDDAVTD